MSQAPKVSILFRRAQQVVARNKSTFVYESDKSFGQRWQTKQIKRQQALQKFWASEEVPLWWKSASDKALTTFAMGAGIATFITSCVGLFKYANGMI